MITVVCFKWSKPGFRSTYTAEHVITLFNMIQRNTKLPFRFLCITDDPDGLEHSDIVTMKLWDNPCPNYGDGKRPNCYYRLRVFAPEMREVLGERFIWLDLDCVITGNIDHILDTRTDFAIWKPDGERMPCNGSMVLHRAGTRTQIWSRFDKRQVHPTRGLMGKGVSGSDQAWIALNLKSTDEFFGQKDGVYSWRSHVEPVNPVALPEGAKIVFFNGAMKPWGIPDNPWVREYYR